ncbi:unnamed protein product, partial [Prorocentrum cordatum]
RGRRGPPVAAGGVRHAELQRAAERDERCAQRRVLGVPRDFPTGPGRRARPPLRRLGLPPCHLRRHPPHRQRRGPRGAGADELQRLREGQPEAAAPGLPVLLPAAGGGLRADGARHVPGREVPGRQDEGRGGARDAAVRPLRHRGHPRRPRLGAPRRRRGLAAAVAAPAGGG